MSLSVKRSDARGLKAGLHDGEELALLDAREELTFGERHILMASCMPLGRVEVMADDMVPHRRRVSSSAMMAKALLSKRPSE